MLRRSVALDDFLWRGHSRLPESFVFRLIAFGLDPLPRVPYYCTWFTSYLTVFLAAPSSTRQKRTAGTCLQPVTEFQELFCITRTTADTLRRSYCATSPSRGSVQPVQCSLCNNAAAPLLQALLAARQRRPEKKTKQKAGHLATHRDARQSSTGATSSTREPIYGLLSPKGQAHTPPGNLWLYKNAGSMCCECLRTDTRKTTTHTTQSAADGRREGSRRHRWFSSSRRE